MVSFGDLGRDETTIDIVLIIPSKLANLEENELVLYQFLREYSCKYKVTTFLDFKNLFSNKKSDANRLIYVLSKDYEGIANIGTFQANLQYILPLKGYRPENSSSENDIDIKQIQDNLSSIKTIFLLNQLLRSNSYTLINGKISKIDNSNVISSLYDMLDISSNQVGTKIFDCIEKVNSDDISEENCTFSVTPELLTVFTRILLFLSSYLQYEDQDITQQKDELKYFIESLTGGFSSFYEYIIKSAIHRFISGFDQNEISEQMRLSTSRTLLKLSPEDHVDLMVVSALWKNNVFLSPSHFFLDMSATTNIVYNQFKLPSKTIKSIQLTALRKKIFENLTTHLENKIVNVLVSTGPPKYISFIAPLHLSSTIWNQFKNRLKSKYFLQIMQFYPFKNPDVQLLNNFRNSDIPLIYQILYDRILASNVYYPKSQLKELKECLSDIIEKYETLDIVDRLFLSYISFHFMHDDINLYPDEGSTYNLLAGAYYLGEESHDFDPINALYQKAFFAYKTDKLRGFYLTKLYNKAKVNHIFFCSHHHLINQALSSVDDVLAYYYNNISLESYTYSYGFLTLFNLYGYSDIVNKIYKWFTRTDSGNWESLGIYYAKMAKIHMNWNLDPIHSIINMKQFLEYHFLNADELNQGNMAITSSFCLIAGVLGLLDRNDNLIDFMLTELADVGDEKKKHELYGPTVGVLEFLKCYIQNKSTFSDMNEKLGHYLNSQVFPAIMKSMIGLMIYLVALDAINENNSQFKENSWITGKDKTFASLLRIAYDLIEQDSNRHIVLLLKILANNLPESISVKTEENIQLDIQNEKDWEKLNLVEILTVFQQKLLMHKLQVYSPKLT